MADAKKHEENASRVGVAPGAGRDIPDNQLEGVAGGAGNAPRCPVCGSTNYYLDGANHIMVCEDCTVHSIMG